MYALDRTQRALLVGLTLSWGVNWPIMKFGLMGYPPLSFRMVTIWLGLPMMGLILLYFRVPIQIPRRHWRELLLLSVTNMVVTHACIVLAVKQLSSGRAAILTYTMPIFSALIGALFFRSRLTRRAWLGVFSAGMGVILLLWHELTDLAGNPSGVVLALFAAATWALGTHLLQRTSIEAPTLAISFWMLAITGVVMTALAMVFEGPQWKSPSHATWLVILFNALVIFSLAQAAWFTLARSLPPVASTLSVMFIPILGLFAGALWLRETLRWADWTAAALMMTAIASVLFPSKR